MTQPNFPLFTFLPQPVMTEGEILKMVSLSTEFEQIKVRDEELNELDRMLEDSCWLPVAGGVENSHGKVNALLQTFISRWGWKDEIMKKCSNE